MPVALSLRIVFVLVVIACIPGTVYGQNQSEETTTSKIDRLSAENEKLRTQVVALSLEIQELKVELKDRQPEARSLDSEQDYLAVGTNWKGRMDGRGRQGGDHHDAADAVITARSDDGFQMRIRTQDGTELLITCSGTNNKYKISEVDLINSPDKNAPLGTKLINSSQVTVTVAKSGPPTMKASMVAPRGNSGITITYTLQPVQ